MTEGNEYDFWSDEHQAMLRPTPRLKFKLIMVPAPEYGENVSKRVTALHQMFKNMNGGGDVWLQVELEDA